MSTAPSGAQFGIAHGDQRATIVEVGGGVREYTVGGRDVLHPYAVDAICDGAHGAPLIPWPNRLADGRYPFDGGDFQLALTEPEKRNAIHGLVRWRSWHALDHDGGRVVVATRLHPLAGWPFALDVSISYSLGDSGLTVETRTTNIGDRPCPFGSGQHPYLSPGAGESVDRCTLELHANTRILTDPDRALPVGREPVEGTAYDFRSPREIGTLVIDDPLTDLEPEEYGLTWVRLGCPDGHVVALWCDSAYSVIEILTADTLAPERRRQGLAAEPMTCPPNALATGEGIVRLEPGASHFSRWGVGLS